MQDKHNLLSMKPSKPQQAAWRRTEASQSTEQASAVAANHTEHNTETLPWKVTFGSKTQQINKQLIYLK